MCIRDRYEVYYYKEIYSSSKTVFIDLNTHTYTRAPPRVCVKQRIQLYMPIQLHNNLNIVYDKE